MKGDHASKPGNNWYPKAQDNSQTPAEEKDHLVGLNIKNG
jgi:hypothetical protein